MKRTIIICSSVLAVVLMLTLLGTSVFAAINKSFGTGNVIKFVGKGTSMKFTLNAIITGTTIDGDERLQTTWEYDYDEKDKAKNGEWNIEPILLFEKYEDGRGMKITYTFSIKNEGNVGIKAFINGNRQTDLDFIIDVVGKPDDDDMVYINVGDTQSVSLSISPQEGNVFLLRPIDCNFNVNFLEF